MAIYDAGGYKLVMRDDLCERAQLVKDGWTVIASGTTKSDAHNDPVWYWLMAPPEPTLAERMREAASRGHGWSGLMYEAADALEHYERVEAAAQHIVDEIMPIAYGGWSVTHEDLDALIDALKEDSNG